MENFLSSIFFPELYLGPKIDLILFGINLSLFSCFEVREPFSSPPTGFHFHFHPKYVHSGGLLNSLANLFFFLFSCPSLFYSFFKMNVSQLFDFSLSLSFSYFILIYFYSNFSYNFIIRD